MVEMVEGWSEDARGLKRVFSGAIVERPDWEAVFKVLEVMPASAAEIFLQHPQLIRGGDYKGRWREGEGEADELGKQ